MDITEKIREIVKKHANKESKACLVYVLHATCSVIVNENYDPAICQDILDFLKKQVPQGIWEHDKTDGNGDSHIKSIILGPSQIIPIENNSLRLGRYQNISLAEFDGPRERKVIVKIL